MKIHRAKLVEELFDFSLRGNGVIIGSPGIGKTYLLRELRRSLNAAGILNLLLPIERLGDGTPETLREELSIEGDLIEELQAAPKLTPEVDFIF